MNYEESVRFFDLIRQAGNENDEDWIELYNDFMEHAVEYAHTRAQWYFMTPNEIGEANKSRTVQHDIVISSIDILARYAKSKDWDASWETILDRDRKDIGDFACYIHAIIGIGRR
ncbi:MAG TPA: hypothetical protein VM577_20415 [Anaerovoracaceae bacterium]|nr:hypothetical protein [Anaerovoracaceae bacterium]